MINGVDVLSALPTAIYTTDAAGRITYYNEAAAEFWGHRPEVGKDLWCGSWRLFWPDGRPMPHDECPMAVALKEGKILRGVEAIAERPDGSRIAFMPYPTLLKNNEGQVTGAINLLADMTARANEEILAARLAAIVSSSDDAIISKTLDSIVTSWNAGATRIFGYEPEEMIGQSIVRIIPPELHDEESQIIAKLRRGERIDHFDTVRVAKDGRRVDISLTVSPLHDKSGRIIGASKVARDITDRKRSEELQRLLFDELNHRVKNTLAIIQAIASQSLRKAAKPEDFVVSFNGRVQALARAHDLLVQRNMKGADMIELIREQVVFGGQDGERVTCSGPLVVLDPRTTMQLALVIHELATNARKYGALSVPSGRLVIKWSLQQSHGRELNLIWAETGVAGIRAPSSHGFGTTLIERSVDASGGTATFTYGREGLSCAVRFPLPHDIPQTPGILAARRPANALTMPLNNRQVSKHLHGKRVLIIEDEPLVAMEIESELMALGIEVVGRAGTVPMAKKFISDSAIDAALVDANLGGQPVNDIVAALTQKQIPFALATGYGRDALPRGFEHVPFLSKPFEHKQLVAVVEDLLADT